VLALSVVVLGAYVRLTDAGLGCPDWPGCYGHIDVPRTAAEIESANQAYPDRPVEIGKAWNEMLHRYLASFLGLVIVVLAFSAWRRRQRRQQQVALPLSLVALVIFQGLLGMWTVTLLLKPAIVTGHLLGGMTITALLWLLALRHCGLFMPTTQPTAHRTYMWLSALGLVILSLQIALGGWTSTNYAAMACPDFPTCHTQWLPWWDADQAFKIWHGLGADYEGGVLTNEARVTIHAVHRLGALITFLYIGALAVFIATRECGNLRGIALIVLACLVIQVGLGIANVVMSLPLPVAVAHNGGAAVLLLTMITLLHSVIPRRTL
jgi:cytochrome c oxidase assembly protein subunit 15